MGDLTETLQALASCEERITQLTGEVERLPGAIGEAEAKASQARAVIDAEREAITGLEHDRRERETELQDAEVQRNKFRSQTAMVKTNAEYHALLGEIDQTTARISELEEKILVAMDQVDERSEKQKGLEREQEELERGHQAHAAELKAQLEKARQEIAALEPERDSVLKGLEPEPRNHYNRMRSAKGTGITRIHGRVCAACHRDIPFEMINRVIAGEWQTCPSCQRTMVMAQAE
jgi:predicted  nucleic acid-binding Zn-ribbon protein